MSRIHKLELELKRLRQENEDLKLDKFHTDANKIEKETIIENLNKQVDSMKKRQVRTNNEQIMNLEDENKKMVKEITLLETKVNKLERENKQLQSKWTEAKDIADKIDDFANER